MCRYLGYLFHQCGESGTFHSIVLHIQSFLWFCGKISAINKRLKTAHSVSHVRFLLEMAPITRQTAQHTAFQRETICVHEVALPLRQTWKCFEYGNCIYREKTFEMMASFNALSEKGCRPLRRKSDGGRLERWLTGEEVCGQLRISPRTLPNVARQAAYRHSQINRRFYYKPEELEADSAYRYALSRRQESLLFTHTIQSYDEREQRCFYTGGRAACHRGFRICAKALNGSLHFENYRPPLDGGTLPDGQGGGGVAPCEPPYLARAVTTECCPLSF